MAAISPGPSHSRPARPGLRLLILLALAGVILVAYVPLFFAIAQVTRATSLGDRERAARALGHAVAVHVVEALDERPRALDAALDAHVGEGGALAIAVYDASGARIASAGPEREVAAIEAPAPSSVSSGSEASRRARTRTGGRALDVIAPAGRGAVLVRVAAGEDASGTSRVVRGVALYMAVFALALLVFAYFALTRTIVRPIERLARAADRVASGARSLDLPRAGAREIADLGTSVRSMAQRLIAEEEAMRAKVEELTTTTRRLTETREQLAGSEHMASVGRLAAGVAHEIGNPIAAIMGLHDLLDEGELPDETRADFMRRMRKETERIHVVVRDLLDYARPEDGPASARAVASVPDIVSDALALVRPQRGFRGVDVDVDVEPDLRVALSPQRLTQVLLNLLLNAGAALMDKPKDEPRTVTVRARGDGEGRARIEIEDDGPGVPEELRARIFDPFVTTKDVGSGTGLGLSVCRGIVEGAGGRVTVGAGARGGARFVIELPRA